MSDVDNKNSIQELKLPNLTESTSPLLKEKSITNPLNAQNQAIDNSQIEHKNNEINPDHTFSQQIASALEIENSKSEIFDYNKVESNLQTVLDNIEKEKMSFKKNYKKHKNISKKSDVDGKSSKKEQFLDPLGQNDLRLSRLENKFSILIDRLEKSASPSTTINKNSEILNGQPQSNLETNAHPVNPFLSTINISNPQSMMAEAQNLNTLTRIQILEVEKKEQETDIHFLKQKLLHLTHENKKLTQKVKVVERRNHIGSIEYTKLSTSYNELKYKLEEMNRIKSSSVFERIKDFEFLENFARSLKLTEKGFGEEAIRISGRWRNNKIFQTFAALADAESMLKQMNQCKIQNAEITRKLNSKIKAFEDLKQECERLNQVLFRHKKQFELDCKALEDDCENRILKNNFTHEEEKSGLKFTIEDQQRKLEVITQKLAQEVESKAKITQKKNFFESNLSKLQAEHVQLQAEHKEALKYEALSQGLNEVIDRLKSEKSTLQDSIEVSKREQKNQEENWQLKMEKLKRDKESQFKTMVLEKNSEIEKLQYQNKNNLGNFSNLTGNMSANNATNSPSLGENGSQNDQNLIQKCHQLEIALKAAEGASLPLQQQLSEARKQLKSQKEEIANLHEKVKEAQLNSGAVDPKILQEMEELKTKITIAENSKITMKDAYLGKIDSLKLEIQDYKKLEDRKKLIQRKKDSSEGKKLSTLREEAFIDKYLMMELKLEFAQAELAKQKKLHTQTVKQLKDQHKKDIKQYKGVQSYADIKDEGEKLKKLKEQLLIKNEKIMELQKEINQLQELKILVQQESDAKYKALEARFGYFEFLVDEYKEMNVETMSKQEQYAKAMDFCVRKNLMVETRYQQVQNDYQVALQNIEEGGDSEAAKEEIEKLKKEVEEARDDAALFQNKMASQMMMISEMQDKEDGLVKLLKKNKIKIPKGLM